MGQSDTSSAAVRVAVFDVGGTLRRNDNPDGTKKLRNYPAIRALYRTLLQSKGWKVVIVTAVPKDQDEARVRARLAQYNIPEPEELYITYGHEQKGDLYAQLKPDLVFEDDDRWLAQALEHGALALDVV